MNELLEKKTSRFSAWFYLCPVRHVLAAVGTVFLGLYFLLRQNDALMAAVSRNLVRPYHAFMARITALVPFSVAECLIAIVVIAALAYLIRFAICMIRQGERLRRLYRLVITALTAFVLIYGGFCLFWGVYYYTSDFEDRSGIRAQPLSVEQLETVTIYFTRLLNQYNSQILRDDNGSFAEDLDACFASSPGLYRNAEQAVPCLAGDPVRAKPVLCSFAMSYINFTGFYFPFTGEANINVDSPACLVPSTIAHEQAHQRGVAEEDEANFCAVLSSLESGDPVYCYSACLLAYIHLGNALYSADYDAWARNYDTLSPGIRTDLTENNAYWARYETPVSTVSDAVYTGFLESYGQTLGLKTYGKCVDLLVTYYYDAAVGSGIEIQE